MNDITEKSANQFWKKIATLIGVGIVLFASIYFGKKYKKSQKTAEITEFYNQFSDETYIDFAKKLEKSIHTENPEVFNKNIDLASFFDFSANDLSRSYHKRQVIKSIRPYFNFGNTISDQLTDSNDFKFTKFYKKDGVPHIVFRLYRADLTNFMDFTLGIKKGKIMITNVYVFHSGTLFSEMISEMYYKIINEEKAFVSNMNTHQQVNNYLQSDNYEEAYNLLTSIPVEKRNSLHQHLLLSVAGNYDVDKFIEVINYMKNLKPDDKRLHAYLNLQESIISTDIDSLNAAIEDLKKYVGEDPVFDLYRGLIYNSQSGFKQAAPFFDFVIAQDPDFFDAYYYKLFNLLLQDKKEEALSLIAKMRERFLINEEDLTFDLQEYQEFTNSEAYKNIFKSAE